MYVLRIDGNGWLFPDKKPVDSKITNSFVNFDFAQEVKKLNQNNKDLKTIENELMKTLCESEFTDEKGNLKPGVSPDVALESDGTLKEGWSVDETGKPHYQRPLKFSPDRGFFEQQQLPEAETPPVKIIIDGKEVTIQQQFGRDPGFEQPLIPNAKEEMLPPTKVIIDGKEIVIPARPKFRPDPGFDQRLGAFKEVPKYEIKDGKLIQTGTVNKFVEYEPGQRAV